MTLAQVRATVEAAGLSYRGAFHPDTDDMPADEAAGTLVMLGFVGAVNWPTFTASPEYKDGRPHPLDRWSYKVINGLAKDLSARAYFPFTAPPMPFIRWAQKAEPVRPSAMGMMIHPDFGLWHAWRGALAFQEKLDLPPPDERPKPCDSCEEKPCLAACPVNAFDGTGAYNVPACATHIRRPEGADCVSDGCRARRACPVGATYQYTPEQAEFHMRSFRGG